MSLTTRLVVRGLIYKMRAEPVITSNGQAVTEGGFTLTTELIQREAIAATIIDDYASSSQQLGDVYSEPSGAWAFSSYRHV